jgi:hypothetical protein
VVSSRRHFLSIGALGSLATFLNACTGSGTQSDSQRQGPQIVSLFSTNRVIAAGRPERLPFGLVDGGADLADAAEVAVRVLLNGEVIETLAVAGRIVDHDHAPGAGDHEHANLLRYYAVRTTLPEVGIYDFEVTVGDTILVLPVQAFDPAEIDLPITGDVFPSLETPTISEPREVDPVCTLFDGPCPFHTRTAADVLAEGQPMALLVATPAFCATSYCGPVLNTLIEASTAYESIGFVHVEPWANPTEGTGLTDPNLRTSPSVDDLRLTFEPSLFLVDRSGLLVERIDNVFDATELTAALDVIA